jgi:hypothetical protein
VVQGQSGQKSLRDLITREKTVVRGTLQFQLLNKALHKRSRLAWAKGEALSQWNLFLKYKDFSAYANHFILFLCNANTSM